ncbi:MAG TPA: acyl-CoA dehydrogenase family protein [Acidimicrobiales bacterium]|nr:acyl-CoA dehydrogenase family protein [Acidimicrobiales bacterium]
MHFEDTPEQAAWREECRAWITDALDRIRRHVDPIARSKAWQAEKFDAGLAKITWEAELGGRGGSPQEQIVFDQEEAAQKTPPNLFTIGLDFVAPTLRVHGTPAQKETYLRPLLRGDTVWCQMFSEPGAGSDSAGLATKAVRDGDEWVLDGQKVWTSHAHFADYAEVLCRTNPDVPKHQGITAFVLDLRAPGVTVRPLKQMTGTADFNEVFLEGVRVPHENVIGAVDDGWHVAVTTLMNERTSIGGSGGLKRSTLAFRLAELGRRRGTLDDVARQRIADVHIRSELQRFLSMRMLTAALQGRQPGPEGSVAKLGLTKLKVDSAQLGIELLGAGGLLDEGEDAARWVQKFLWSPGMRLGGGTDEVNRNIVAERVLGLPGEPRTDDTLPWNQVPR